LQDLLNLGSDARMNQPGHAEGNWQWRCTAEMLTPTVWQWLRDLTLASNRALAVARNPGPA
jgi:4-alpha-glucanotransferase